MEQKISVIIPVYNAEKYLLTTLNCIRSQTHRNLEILCVLDCPTDNSAEVVRTAANEDDRIKIITNLKNSGPSETRNNGLKNASGEYIHFMDSDDLINYDFYEVLLNVANRTDADVCACSVFFEKRPKQSILFTTDEVVTDNDKILKTEVLYRDWVWRYLIKKDFWDENNFSFTNSTIDENIAVTVPLIHRANKIAICSDAVYFYKNRHNSLSNQLEKKGNRNTYKGDRGIKDILRKHDIKHSSGISTTLKEFFKSKYICTNDPIIYGSLAKKISVIMPVYNVEKHLAQALNSIRFQTYNNLEIICILDCPTDNSAQIAAQIASEDPRIKLIVHKTNRGLPAARHSGVEAAQGEYIHFMDSDDWLSPDFYETLVHEIEKENAEVAACSVYYEKKPLKSIWFRKSEVLSDTDEKLEKTEVTIRGWAWKYLISTKFWKAHKFYFPDLVPMEDKPIMIEMIYHADKVILCPSAVYFYKNRENSILNKAYDPIREKRDSTNRKKARRIITDFLKQNKIKRPSRLKYYLKKYIG